MLCWSVGFFCWCGGKTFLVRGRLTALNSKLPVLSNVPFKVSMLSALQSQIFTGNCHSAKEFGHCALCARKETFSTVGLVVKRKACMYVVAILCSDCFWTNGTFSGNQDREERSEEERDKDGKE